MNKIIATAVLATILSFNANCQLDKGNWLLGGTVSYSNTEITGTVLANETKSTLLISGRIGYFFLDKTCLGVLPTINNFKQNVTGTTIGYKVNEFNIGPFIRQYFLSKDKQINLFGELGYLFNSSNTFQPNEKGGSTTTLVGIGTSYYLNSSVAIELGVNYSNQRFKVDNMSSAFKTLRFGIGLQFHLQKN